MIKHLQLNDCFNGKTVVITGHTGFKGSWLSIWLNMLGARVIGISSDIPTSPSNFAACALDKLVEDHRINLDDHEAVRRLIHGSRPDFVFHLAAQALVNQAYQNPLETLQTNIMGTAHVLESLRTLGSKCTAVMITSDKCYDNVEWEWGYRENDRIGGKDPYSASKGGAELVIRTYYESFLVNSGVRLAVARAGNVIGGGDWARDRLVPDCIRSWSLNDTVAVKNPATTRPWQLVLEPLGGYLALAMSLAQSDRFSGHAFNFGPLAESNYSVVDLIEEMRKHWENVSWTLVEPEPGSNVYEAALLKLNCDKALHLLSWRPTLQFDETVEATMQWYRTYYQNKENMLELCQQQIGSYCTTSLDRGIAWAS